MWHGTDQPVVLLGRSGRLCYLITVFSSSELLVLMSHFPPEVDQNVKLWPLANGLLDNSPEILCVV